MGQSDPGDQYQAGVIRQLCVWEKGYRACGNEEMDRAKVISVSDVLAEERSKVHETCSKAVLHQVPESETTLARRLRRTCTREHGICFS